MRTSKIDNFINGKNKPTFVKYPDADIGELVMSGLFVPGRDQMFFMRQDFDKKQWWLMVVSRGREYMTSINITQWNKWGLETKYAVVKHALDKVLALLEERVEL